MKTKLLIGILLIFATGGTLWFFQINKKEVPTQTEQKNQTNEPVITIPAEKPREEIPQKSFCPQKRNNERIACTEIYKPVCAEIQVQCFRAPCPPLPHTFGNSCEACNNPLVNEYTEGECAKK